MWRRWGYAGRRRAAAADRHVAAAGRPPRWGGGEHKQPCSSTGGRRWWMSSPLSLTPPNLPVGSISAPSKVLTLSTICCLGTQDLKDSGREGERVRTRLILSSWFAQGRDLVLERETLLVFSSVCQRSRTRRERGRHIGRSGAEDDARTIC